MGTTLFRSKPTRLFVAGLLLFTCFTFMLGCSRTKNDEDWVVTGTFDIPATAADGTSFSYRIRGVQGQFGFIDYPFVAGKGNKYMWHFWGKPEEYVGKTLDVTAVSRSGQTVNVFSGGLGGANNGAVAHTPSSMTLPTAGLWRIDVRVGGHPIGSIVVDVKAEG